MPRIKRAVATQKLFGPSLVYTSFDDGENCGIIDDDDENQFAKGQRSRDLRGRSDANGDLAQTKSSRADDLKIMNLVILINSAQMFFRNFGLRHVNAALGLAIGLAVQMPVRKSSRDSRDLLNGCDRGSQRSR